jgi:hypothetical protein
MKPVGLERDVAEVPGDLAPGPPGTPRSGVRELS